MGPIRGQGCRQMGKFFPRDRRDFGGQDTRSSDRRCPGRCVWSFCRGDQRTHLRWQPTCQGEEFGQLPRGYYHSAFPRVQQESGTHPSMQLAPRVFLHGRGGFPHSLRRAAVRGVLRAGLCGYEWQKTLEAGERFFGVRREAGRRITPRRGGARGFRQGGGERRDVFPRGYAFASRCAKQWQRFGRECKKAKGSRSRKWSKRSSREADSFERKRREEETEEHKENKHSRDKKPRRRSPVSPEPSFGTFGFGDHDEGNIWRVRAVTEEAGAERESRSKGIGAKRRYYEFLESEESPWDSEWPAGPESCGTSPRRHSWRFGSGRRNSPELETQEEEKEKETQWKEEEKEKQKTARRRRTFRIRQLLKQRRQQRIRILRPKQLFERQCRERVPSPSEEAIRAQAWQHASTTTSADRRAAEYSTGCGGPPIDSAGRHESLELLSPPSEGLGGECFESRRKGIVFDSSIAGFAESGPAGPSGRRSGCSISRPSTGSHGWPLGSGPTLRDFHTRPHYSSWSRIDPSSTSPWEAGGEGERFRCSQEPLGSEQLLLGKEQGQLEHPDQRGTSGQLERKRKERQEFKEQEQEYIVARRSRPGEPSPEGGREGEEGMKEESREDALDSLLEATRSLQDLGIALWVLLFRVQKTKEESTAGTAPAIATWWRKVGRGLRVSRPKRALFPLPTVWDGSLHDFGHEESLHDLLKMKGSRNMSFFCWCELSVLFCNRLFDETLGFGEGPPTKAQEDFLRSIEQQVRRILQEDCNLQWGSMEVREDFKKKNLSYTGEEICKAEPLTLFRMAPALPPLGHGGSIELSKWVEGHTKWFIEHPHECIVPDTGQVLPKLQAKMHLAPGESLSIAKLLVARRICRWVPEGSVLRYRQQKVLNGMFGVPKSKVLSNGQTALRTIMNLIPSNSILREIPGRIGRLPNICQWLHVCLGPDEEVRICQSDMVAAFYLFALPCSWSERLCFNLSFRGRELNDPSLEAEEIYYLGCAVLPMGWSSAVGVMQDVAESVLLDAGLHSHSQIVRSSPLPEWMVKSLAEGSETGQPWWHVYLDNYASGEKIKKGASPLGGKMQKKVATAWRKAGILTAEEKNLKDGKEATELGAYIGGEGQWLGASTERVFRTCKATCWVLRQQYLGRKTLQMLMGRWTFCMQFRRPFMSHFQATWEVLSRDRPRKAASDLCRDELVFAMYGSCLMHTWLGMKVDDQVMCSDASLSGGAVAIAKKLEPEGRAFLFSQQPSERAIPIPVLLISLFNGISGARRSYDVAGVEPRATVCVDMHKPANRVSSKRWPSSEFWLDIRNFTAEVIEEIIVRHEDCEEIHIWFGFPCVDLSSAKAYRQNLAGTGSSLIFEAQRVRKEVEKFARGKRVRFVAENVASMDKEAREEISRFLGVKPYRLDPANQVPMSRPRYCWTDIEVFATKEVTLIDKVTI